LLLKKIKVRLTFTSNSFVAEGAKILFAPGRKVPFSYATAHKSLVIEYAYAASCFRKKKESAI